MIMYTLWISSQESNDMELDIFDIIISDVLINNFDCQQMLAT